MKSIRNFLLILLLAILLGGGGVIYYYYQVKNMSVVENKTPDKKPENVEVTKKEIPEEVLPGEFPADMPVEVGALITQNFTVTTPDGRTQATRGFVTKKTLAENYKIYSEYLNKNNWKIEASIDQPAIKILSASNTSHSIKIDITENTTLNQRTVVISLITDKKTK